MKAVLIKQAGGPENLTVSEYDKPQPQEGLVLIKVKAFGINRAELYMRKGEWGETTDIIGIECVGFVEADPSGKFKKGQKVAAICGGMSRSVNGSYAEYTNVPKTNVIPIETNLPWNELAAIPETYATAWALLNWGLNVQSKETLLVRGGSSTLGQACIILAKQFGLRVIATTRSEKKSALLHRLGAYAVIVDNGEISNDVLHIAPEGVDQVIELTGTHGSPTTTVYIRIVYSGVTGFLVATVGSSCPSSATRTYIFRYEVDNNNGQPHPARQFSACQQDVGCR